jgi:hypothetical protein
MASPVSTSPDTAAQEQQLLGRLLRLYQVQQQLYGEVLALSRRQCELVRQGAPLAEIRGVLEAKKCRLTAIGNLDRDALATREAWRRGRHGWTAAGRAQLHQALTAVGQAIEEILACEQENDRELLQRCR